MIKRFYLILFFLHAISSVHSQFDTVFAKTSIRHCVDSLAYGFKTKNWDVFTRYSYPALVGSLGGQEDFKNYMAMIYAAIPDSAWKLYEPGKILQVIKTDGDLQTVVELKSVLEWEGNLITTVSYLIGESWNGGLIWTFFDSEGDRTRALLIKPDLSSQLVLPQKRETTEPAPVKAKGKNKP